MREGYENLNILYRILPGGIAIPGLTLHIPFLYKKTKRRLFKLISVEDKSVYQHLKLFIRRNMHLLQSNPDLETSWVKSCWPHVTVIYELPRTSIHLVSQMDQISDVL